MISERDAIQFLQSLFTTSADGHIRYYIRPGGSVVKLRAHHYAEINAWRDASLGKDFRLHIPTAAEMAAVKRTDGRVRVL